MRAPDNGTAPKAAGAERAKSAQEGDGNRANDTHAVAPGQAPEYGPVHRWYEVIASILRKLEQEGVSCKFQERVRSGSGVFKRGELVSAYRATNVFWLLGSVGDPILKTKLKPEVFNARLCELLDGSLEAEFPWEVLDIREELEAAELIVSEEKSIKFFSVLDIKGFPPVQYVIEKYFPLGAVVNVSAYTGAGKSVISSSASISAMSGLPFLGKFRVFKIGPVLYFDEESPRSYLKDRIEKMRFRDDDPFFLAHFTGLKLDKDKDFELILEQVQQRAPVLVVFDTLIRFHTADENGASEMAVVMGRLRKLANLGPCILTQIHANKSTGEMRTRSRGSSDIIGGCDLELSISEEDPKKNPGLLTLRSVKARLAPVEPVTLRIQEINGELSAILDDTVPSEVTLALDEILEEAHGAMSVTAMLTALKAQDIEPSRSTVQRAIDAKLEKDPGSLEKTQKGRAYYYALNREKQ